MTDYINPHKIYPEDTSRRIDTPPGNDSIRPGRDDSHPPGAGGGRMRLIDADALYYVFERTPWMDNADRDIAEEVMDNAPTVNPCDNCMVYEEETTNEERIKEVLLERIAELELLLKRATSCEGCTWKGIRRYSKCENCRRNARTPDNYC